MAKSSNEITQGLFEAVDTIIGERISSLPYDLTIVCLIEDATDHANGIYIVTHDYATHFTAYADYTGFNVGDYVYVRIPEGDYTKLKVITGKYLEGFITSSETYNILNSDDLTYYFYNTDNFLHDNYESQIVREIKFSYFNSIKAEQKWEDVLNLYTLGSMDYERPKAIKVSINNDDIIVYIYKYKLNAIAGSPNSFAAELYGVTNIDYMPDIVGSNKALTILQIPALLSNIKNIQIYWNNGICIKYTIASELNTSMLDIPITVLFCPIDETYNISSTIYLHFGYLNLLKKEINPVFKLIRVLNNVENIVNAFYKSDYTISSTGSISTNNILYYLRIYILDKYGKKINNTNYRYKWKANYSNTTISTAVNLLEVNLYTDMATKNGNTYTFRPAYYTVTLSINNIDYDTYYYPLAWSNLSQYYASVPSIIEYNEAGVNPQYYNEVITLKSRNSTTNLSYKLIKNNNDNNYTILSNNIISVYNYFTNNAISYLQIVDSTNTNTIYWYLTLVFYKKSILPIILTKNIPLNNPHSEGSAGAIAAQATDTAGMSLRYNNNILSLSAYNNDQTPHRIFHLNSNGLLEIGYNTFVVTGHVTSGATCLKSGISTTSTGTLYNVGSNVKPIYFKNGIPVVSTGTVGNSKTFIYLNNGEFQSVELINNNNKIITSYTTSYKVNLTAAKTLTNDDNGKFFYSSNNITITLPTSLIDGFECEVYNNYSGDDHSIKFSCANKIYCADVPEGANTLLMTEARGVTVLKYIGHWILTGSIESV